MEATTFMPFVSVSSHNMLTKTEIYVFIWGFYVIDIGNQYQKEYQKAVDSCGDYTKYTNVDSYENLITIKDEILQKIISCESVNITTPGKYYFDFLFLWNVLIPCFINTCFPELQWFIYFTNLLNILLLLSCPNF